MPPAERLLDVHTLAAPEPLVLTLAAVEALPSGTYLRMRHRMKPCLLYDRIGPLGFAHDTRRSADGMCEVFIWRSDDGSAAEAARIAAAALAPWSE